MNNADNYREINRHSWNNRVETHLQSDFYDLKGFLAGQNSLNDIELALLGDIKGKSILHLQCHFGQDSISLTRLGASVTGVDFSDKAIDSAQKISQETGAGATFICCDIYDLPAHLNTRFDIVFTSYGTIGWLPDLNRWASLVSNYLKSGGKFVFVEFHPVMWMFDNDINKIIYSYFKDSAIVESETGSYADKTAPLTHESITWNHSLGEVIGSLLQNGLEITGFREYDYSPYNCFNGTVKSEDKKFRIGHLDGKIPMVYSVVAIKK